jgi:branched-chain amino acid transport system permease protein
MGSAVSPLAYLLRRNAVFFWVSAAYAVVIGLAQQLGLVFSDVVVTSGIYFILVMGLDFLYGYTGLLSLGQVGFFAIGAYTVGILANQAAIGFFISALVALVVNISLGILLGWVFLRLRGSYFMLGSLAFGLVVHAIINIWYSVTGGDAGLGGVQRPVVLGHPLMSDRSFGVLVWTLTLVLFWLAINITRSRIGRALLAIRSDEISAAASGIYVARVKISIFAISAGYASLGGSLFASYHGTLHPEDFSMGSLLNLLLMMFFGGEGTIWGGLLGATFLQLLPDLSGALHNSKILFSGILFSIIIFFFPQGVAGEIGRLLAPYVRWRSATSDAKSSSVVHPEPKTSDGGLLVVKGASRRFGGLIAVDGVTITVERGRITGLIGPNGAGKSTLLNLISGVLRSEEGHISFDGHELTELRSDQIARLGLQRTFQHERLFTKMTVLENVTVGCERGTSGRLRDFISCALALPWTLREELAAHEEAYAWLDRIGLHGSAGATVANLPHGLKKLVEIGRAMAARPSLLLLDETAAGLNESEKAQFKELIRSLRDSGVTIMIIEHDIDFIMTICDQVVVLNFGQKIAEGSPAMVRKNQAVLEAYLGA